ncbi:MAG: HAMP domain-containing histidine kinase [Lachnospiraceae bacterium]|nr:HAMP domain-containing histidine kinase [Lachnospiraceae bacterium]
MNLWNADRVMERLNLMLEHAISGEPIETSFDETKMSALETKLAQYLKMNQLGKQQLNDEKERIDALISDISHQTKTPIANMLLYSELLAEEIQDEKSKEMLEAIHFQAEKLSFLTQSLVKISRLESGVIQTVPEKNSVSELIEKVVTQVEPKASMKDIYIDVSSVDGEALFDMKWTSEAIGNIVDNAVKYTNIGGNIQITVNEYSLFTRIDIRDNGIGIAENDLSKIFGRFYKCSTTQQEEGVGLGLYLAREIISGQGGYIKVSSQIEKGTMFSVFLRRNV